jgi:hypothetical protein
MTAGHGGVPHSFAFFANEWDLAFIGSLLHTLIVDA